MAVTVASSLDLCTLWLTESSAKIEPQSKMHQHLDGHRRTRLMPENSKGKLHTHQYQRQAAGAIEESDNTVI